MFNFFKSKKKYILSNITKNKIEKELHLLESNLKDGMFHKAKEFEIGFYINIIINRRVLLIPEISSDDKNIPDYLTFMFILDSSFPEQPPKILLKSNVLFFLIEI
jgi:hypothetical protein